MVSEATDPNGSIVSQAMDNAVNIAADVQNKKNKKTALAALPIKTRATRTRLLIIGVGLIVGSFVGVLAGFIFFITHHKTINIGTITATQTPASISDKDLYATYAGGILPAVPCQRI